jgi:hypothetical protein
MGAMNRVELVDAVAAIRQKMKVAVVERRAGARALTLSMRRGSEVSDGLRSPEQAIPELEISWVSEEREEMEEEEYGTKLETEPEPPLPETHLSRWKKEYQNRRFIS